MKRHAPDWFSLAAGLLFTVLGVTFAVAAANGWSVDGRWVSSLALIALGAGGIAASLAATRRQRAEVQSAGQSDSESWPSDPFA
jgi:protein-S-isoprenylcysteine O-methyltransferase Ste14